jgi:porphobilinogen synthase
MQDGLRALNTETALRASDFIYPIFVKEGIKMPVEVVSMPGVYQHSIKSAIDAIDEAENLGIKAIMLFCIPTLKDSCGSDALHDDGFLATTIKAIKAARPQIALMTDLCFCEYTDHGHCGIMDTKKLTVDNDATLEILAKQAIVHARAGSDMIAPSGMMDGTIAKLRETLDANGFENLPILAYSTKFASGYYGPFRDAAESTPSFGDRRTYQMSPANRREAIVESLEDELEGADALMVKPALAYLDIIRDIRERTLLPLAVYNVSGEYAMLKAAGINGWIDYERVMMETLLSFKRAGADWIITYHAVEAAKILKGI